LVLRSGILPSPHVTDVAPASESGCPIASVPDGVVDLDGYKTFCRPSFAFEGSLNLVAHSGARDRVLGELVAIDMQPA
jgi:hypothetical protein